MVAILSITAIEIVNLLTANIDGAILVFIASLIAGIAGYEVGHRRRGD